MHRIAVLLFTALIAGALQSQAQGLGEVIRTPNKAVPVTNQALAGAWLFELHRGGQAPAVLLFIQFHQDGTIVASAAEGSQSSHHGMWLRTGDGKFLITTFLFSFNENRALANIIKVRANVQLKPDGEKATGTQEIVLMNPEGREITTIPGGTFTGTRLALETPADFQDFRNGQ